MMKFPTKKTLLAWVLATTVALIPLLFSCSATHHLNKAIKKDPTILVEKTKYDTIKISSIDSIPIIVNDTIVWERIITLKDTVVQFKYRYIDRPITRTEYKIIKDTISLAKLRARLTKRTANTKVRVENKKGGIWWFFIGLIVGFIIKIIVKLFLK